MKKWSVVLILSAAQFVMVLDGTVMNVSISTVVADLHSTVTAMQSAITFYTLTMASVMLLGAKLGDVWGRRRALVIGSLIYSAGSLTTALSPNMAVLFLGWSIFEGLGAVLVIPAVAALIADNYDGRDRITAFAVIGAVSGGAVAAGPLIGGFITTYLNWRWVFAGEVVIMIIVVLFAGRIGETSSRRSIRIDLLSVLMSAAGLVAVVYGMLQTKTWGWIVPLHSPEVDGVEIAPLGISLSAWLILAGIVLLVLFFSRQRHLVAAGREPLLHVDLLSIRQLRSGLSVLGAQYAITAGLFFMVPVYLQMTLGLDALETGVRIFPLSVSLIVFSFVGTRLSSRWSPRRIVRIGQWILVASSILLLTAVEPQLAGLAFGAGMFFAGTALGLLASQLGNVNMSAVTEKDTSEVGGLQGVFQNLGSSLGTALIGSILIGALATSFAGGVGASDLSEQTKSIVDERTEGGVAIVPASSVDTIAGEAGLDSDDATTLEQIYVDSQLTSLRIALFGLIVLAVLSLLVSRGIPNQVPLPRAAAQPAPPG
ncbi:MULTISPECIES: MFS transporter [unclassified Microbacterium]|uniref:MFS transporter n=1 Tax=unclassified Microbacterium TaxID=2609290 RepID=UPI00214C7A6B|nr:MULTISPECIES: MFS transporter [unclassified Microbacterium]MCR2810079.1 MFS transporter [Microbacterium sp. zg.B185]WIM20083.1 MFS transporter [Microbacterium sp. zg-B185]